MSNHSKTSNELIGYKLRALYPELAKELTSSQMLADLSLIPTIYETHFKNAPKSEDERFNGRLIFVGVILKLYDPDTLEGWKRNMVKGIRNQLAGIIGVTPTAISNHIGTVQNYMLIYQKFKDKVENLSKEIAEVYRPKQEA